MEHELKRKDGVREKKRRDMHRRITEIGLKLFAENGYEATTLDAIAEASGIARRTFFHYFRSKEEIILAWQNALPGELHAEILKLGGGASPITTTQAALVALAVNMRPDIAVLIGRIVQSTEQLQSGNQAKFLRMEQAAYEGLCEIWPDAEKRFGLRLAAMIGVGTMRLSIDAWVAEGCQRPLVKHLEENFGCLKTELGAC
ncbi:TetR/AcrR family transcriptional regulator [Pectobacterium punjabense]|uniref:TetR/AcrR family transcriptional regulator n=1 Tax=Pectobacterium punjabense TaxID=2108399 RepID=UPI002405C3D4|nr:TetR/AcrR family transcriptional regulator [Pectobacterium punjabense]MDG0798900.1 helix-turn-helix domain containing protein [Pectobacterium punjabense]